MYSGAPNRLTFSKCGTKETPRCLWPECKQKAFMDAKRYVDPFCSNEHKCVYEQWFCCFVCRKRSADPKLFIFCGLACISTAQAQPTPLIIVPSYHQTFKRIREMFEKSWKDPTRSCPIVRYIYKIINTPDTFDRYTQYLKNVRAQCGTLKLPLEEDAWHGTSRECLVGDNDQTTLCSNPACCLCSILTYSYDIGYAGFRGRGRFGDGIYASPASSKNNDFGTNLKALILNKVVVGRRWHVDCDYTLEEPPPGFDSVLGTPIKGGNSTHWETIVYHEDAIRPSYLVIYDPFN